MMGAHKFRLRQGIAWQNSPISPRPDHSRLVSSGFERRPLVGLARPRKPRPDRLGARAERGRQLVVTDDTGERQAWVADLWDQGVRPELELSPEEVANSFKKEVKIHQGGYGGIVAHNVSKVAGAAKG